MSELEPARVNAAEVNSHGRVPEPRYAREPVPEPVHSMFDQAKQLNSSVGSVGSAVLEDERALAYVEGPAVLDATAEWIRRYLSVPSEHCITVLALWAAHTHICDEFYVTPRLIIDSAEPESGKTRVLELLNLLVRNPMFTMNTTIAALYRRLALGPRTILLDETDAIFAKSAAANHEDLRALLNAGYKRGATVDRCVPKRDEIVVVEFAVFAPVALAGIAGNMPDTITTRAVTIHMRRRKGGEKLDDFIEEDVQAEAEPLHDALAAWVTSAVEKVRDARPVMPDGVRDRKAEIWRSLLAVADAAGGDWPRTAREACQHFTVNVDPGEMPLGVRLLSDLRALFGNRIAMSTEDILTALHDIDEAPWASMRGAPLVARGLARLLKKYDVASKKVKLDGKAVQGYRKEDLFDPWARYLPLCSPESAEPTEPTEPDEENGWPDVVFEGSGHARPTTQVPEPVPGCPDCERLRDFPCWQHQDDQRQAP